MSLSPLSTSDIDYEHQFISSDKLRMVRETADQKFKSAPMQFPESLENFFRPMDDWIQGKFQSCHRKSESGIRRRFGHVFYLIGWIIAYVISIELGPIVVIVQLIFDLRESFS